MPKYNRSFLRIWGFLNFQRLSFVALISPVAAAEEIRKAVQEVEAENLWKAVAHRFMRLKQQKGPGC